MKTVGVAPSETADAGSVQAKWSATVSCNGPIDAPNIAARYCLGAERRSTRFFPFPTRRSLDMAADSYRETLDIWPHLILIESFMNFSHSPSEQLQKLREISVQVDVNCSF